MKLSVSNIAWDQFEEEAVIDLLQKQGVTGIEIAPTKYWPAWQGAAPAAAAKIRNDLDSKGFSVPALQAILFDKPELQVFSDSGIQQALLEHLDKVAQLANAFGAAVLVFGSPRNRDPGQLTKRQAFAEGVEFFRRVGDVCMKHGVQLCLEPNPQVYNCRFMTHWQEIQKMVQTVAHPGIGIHLDTACIYLEGDDVVEAVNSCQGNIAHFHVTEPELGDLSKPKLAHAEIGQALRDTNYDKWYSIEMRRSENPLSSIETSVDFVKTSYGP